MKSVSITCADCGKSFSTQYKGRIYCMRCVAKHINAEVTAKNACNTAYHDQYVPQDTGTCALCGHFESHSLHASTHAEYAGNGIFLMPHSFVS